MKGKMKKVVSLLLSIAMIFTSVNITPSTTVGAAENYTYVTFENLVKGQVGYYVEVAEGTIAGWTGNADKIDTSAEAMLRFTFASSDDTATVKVDDGKEVATSNIAKPQSNLLDIYISEMEEGKDYTITFKKGTGTVVLHVIRKSEDTTPTTVQNPTTIQNPTTTEATLDWKADSKLTAALGEGTKYAIVKDNGIEGEVQIQETQLWWISGATMKGSIVLSFNGKEINRNDANSALGQDIQYTSLKAGLNTLVAKETNTAGDVFTYIFYIDVPVKPMNVSVNNYAEYTGKYIIKFDEVDGAKDYNVYVDGTKTSTTIGGSGDYITGDIVPADGKEHTIAISANVETTTGEGESAVTTTSETVLSSAVTVTSPTANGTNNEIPQIYIQTDDLTKAAKAIVKTDGKLAASITAVDKDGGTYSKIYNDTSKTTIKVRGNSTANADKKAFNITFNKAKDLYGMGSAKKWSLLANAFDKSLIRNKLAMDFAQDMGLDYTSNSTYIDLYLNGVYMGNYLAIESIEVGPSRVDIASEDINTNDTLIELENNSKDETEEGVRYITTTPYDVRFNIGSPENGDGTNGRNEDGSFTDAELATRDANTLAFLNKFETDLKNDDYNAYSQYIDVDSFVNFYIVNEFFKNKDFNYSSTRFYIKDNKLYAGPLWDLDLSSGNWGGDGKEANNFYCQEMPWFKALMSNATFKAKVAARYKEKLDRIKQIYSGDGNDVDKQVEAIRASRIRNYTAEAENGAGWSDTVKDSADQWSLAATESMTYDQTITYLKRWFTAREQFLSKEWLNQEPETTTTTTGDDEVPTDATVPKNPDWFTTALGGNSKTTAEDASTYYVLKDYYDSKKLFKAADVFGLWEKGSLVSFGGGDANTLGAAFGFAVSTDSGLSVANTDSVWVGEAGKNNAKKLTKGTEYYANNDVFSIAQSVFALADDEDEKIFTVTLRKSVDGNTHTDYTFALRVVAGDDPLKQNDIVIPNVDDSNWVAFDDRDGRTNVSVYGTYFYVLNDVRSAIVRETALSGLYDNGYDNPYCTGHTHNGWGSPLAAGTPSMSYVLPNGADAIGAVKSIIIDGTKYDGDNVLLSNGGDCVHVAQSLFQLKDGESYHIFKVTVIGETGTQKYALKVVKGKAAAPTGFGYTPAGDGSLPYHFSWSSANTADSYKLYVVNDDGTKTLILDNITGLDCNATALADYADGTYTIGLTAVKDGEESEMATTTFTKGEAEPTDYDIQLVKVDVNYDKFEAGKEITMTATIKNLGKSFTISGTNKLTMHVINESGGEDATLTGQSWNVIDGQEFKYGSTVTHTWKGTIQEALVTKGSITFRVTPEADLLNKDKDMTNNVYTYTFTSIPEITNLKGTVNEDKTVGLTWDAAKADEEDTNTYKYNVYVDGVKVNDTEITDTNYTITGVADGTHEIKVVTVLDGNESNGVTTSVLMYSLDGITWTDGWIYPVGDVDQYGNTWQYAKDYLEVNDVFDNSGYRRFGTATDRFDNKPFYLSAVQSENGTIKSITINGKTYDPKVDEDVVSIVGDQIYLNQELFKLNDDEKDKVFAITVNGNTSHSYLLKVTNSNYATAKLENVDGNVSLSWDADDSAVKGYEVTYTAWVKDADGNATKEEKTVRVATNVTNYSFTDNDIVLANDTSVTVKPVGEDDAVIDTVIGEAKALADLIIDKIETKSVVKAGVQADFVSTVKNIGTARADAKTGEYNVIAVMVLNKTVEGKTYVTGNPVGLTYVTPNDGLEPNAKLEATVSYTFDTVGEYCMEAQADEANRITEKDETNNFKTITGVIVAKDAVTLALDETKQNDNIKLTWNKIDDAESYKITYKHYTSPTDSKEVEETITVNTSDAQFDETTNKYYIYLPNSLVNKSTVEVKAVNGDTETVVGADTAIVDLIIEQVNDPVSTNEDGVRMNYKFSITVLIKNQGTAMVPGTDATETEVFYPYTIPVLMQWEDENGNVTEETRSLNDVYHSGLASGQTKDITFENLLPAKEGENLPFSFKVDATTWAEGGFVDESDEDNNTATKNITVLKKQQNRKMDWTLFTSQMIDENGEPYVKINNSVDQGKLEYKILDTSNKEIDFSDIFTNVEGYGGDFVAFNINTEFPLTNKVGVGYKMEFAQVLSGTIENYTAESDASINYKEQTQGSGFLNDWSGNGWNSNVLAFAPGKYYIVKVTNDDGDYITLALRVPGDLGSWTLMKSTTSSTNVLPAFYHDAAHEVKADFYYDGSDLGLAGITSYHDTHFSVIMDSSKDAASANNWKVVLSYAGVDENGNFIETVGEDGNFNENVDADFAAEVGNAPKTVTFKNDGTGNIGVDGTHVFQMFVPRLFEKLPFHSEKGGNKDTGYYLMKVYPDTVKDPNEYIYIPMRIDENIPEINAPEGVVARHVFDENDQEQLIVGWTENATQVNDDYMYKVFIGDTEISNGYLDAAQSLTFDWNDTYRELLEKNNNKVKVVAYWCEQEAVTEEEVKVPEQKVWIDLDGESQINIQAGQNQFVQTPAKIRYYYDRSENHAQMVIGYNGDYISINGNKNNYNQHSEVSVATEPFDSEDTGKSGTWVKGDTDESKATYEEHMAGLDYKDIDIYEAGSANTTVQILAKDLLTAKHINSYYVARIKTPEVDDNGDIVPGEDGNPVYHTNYIKFHTTVETGEVDLRGFQMNTNSSEGAVSEFSPSFRVVSRAPKLIAVDENHNKIDPSSENNPLVEAVVKYGTMYGLKDNNPTMDMTYDAESGTLKSEDENTLCYTADEGGILDNWSGSANDTDKANYTYYALTFKPAEYGINLLDTTYSLVAYAVTENGDVIYDMNDAGEKDIKNKSVENIAETLYTNNMMATKSDHEYLYDNVLNILAINRNMNTIAQSLLKVMKVTDKNSDNYTYVNTLYKDLYRYVHLRAPYDVKYTERGVFSSKSIDEATGKMNEELFMEAYKTETGDQKYDNSYDLIYNRMKTKGFYRKTEYVDKSDTNIVNP